MDKNSAINLIDKTFNNAFDEAQFTNFIQNLLNDFEIKPNKYSGNTIWEDQRDHVSYYKRIGKYIDPEGEALDVLIVQVKNVSKLERARTALRNFVIKHLNNFEKDYALVAFYSKEDEGFDWRFSFIKMEHQSYLDEEKQKVKMRKEFTPAKRYSFLVGKYEKSNTAKTQLLPLLQNIANNPTISELEKAFSIERVTDEFFEQYKSLYIKVYEYFEKQDLSIFQDSQLNTSGFTKKLLGQIVFLYFLQKKGWLGVPKNERWGAGKRHFLQQLFDESLEKNKNFFKDYLQYLFYEALAKERDNENSYYPRFNCRIPFLNGGLFEAQYDWRNANITIPTDLFRNDEKNKSGDIGTGILDVFDRYNFTIKEDEPLDKEVAVDPEMLGKVFENMLEIKERKSKGAFYTPREIVHYMCQESLIHYLDNALNEDNKTVVPKEDIEQYIREGHLALENDVRVAERGETKTYKFLLPESVRNNADVIDKKLTEIRICDPAIGSGAFPVGLLHELVTAQLILKPHLSYNYLSNKLKEFEFHERESVSESRYVYRLKKHIIQESIYGVDIDRSAIDIARLRLWLSLVVDEDDLEPIETLPNLDYKIVCGNSLIGMPDGTMRDLEVEKELETLKEEFYTVTDEQRKKSLRNKINSKIRKLLDTAETFAGYKIDFDFKLFFSEVWREKGGFDVVIGNPPYGASLTKIQKTNFRTQYPDLEFKIDSYEVFVLMSNSLMKENGLTTYIIPSNLMDNFYSKKIRLNLLNNGINELIELDDKVFKGAVVHSMIVSWSNHKKEDYLLKCKVGSVSEEITFWGEKSFFLNEDNYSFSLRKVEFKKILDSIYFNSIKLENVFKIKDGIDTGNNNKYVSDEEIDGWKKLIGGKNIDRWEIKDWRYVDYGKHLANPRDPELFENDKIVIRETGDRIIATIDKEGYYALSTLYSGFIIDDEYSLEVILSLLHSELIHFIMVLVAFGRTEGAFTKTRIFHYYSLPVSNLLPNYNSVLTILVNFHLFLKKKKLESESIAYFSTIIDSAIYEAFFIKSFQAANKSILKHLTDLKPINDSMSDEGKFGIIQSEYERLYHPDHPVRFAIETLDSIEEVRIIREALKS
ncbi:Eco57I restriction-modification methylase domain-containing protein [Galbibacter mesophilus]|uniref:Eco57I restriction-modification methylase domain-containing protein n=1 Tax=Galbibacter mesophilus TaxID=379069 RepID=UPI00191D93D7|nr:TaqI-like C-terminal specificity domain-containing protein [Galbibacter mesophilus]MCM5664267.1 N-6 DNA methylase [Galbibacter mesophilus]